VTRHGDAHVWIVALDRNAEAVERSRALLAADELDRADRFHDSRTWEARG
jgi:hypothetical protein